MGWAPIKKWVNADLDSIAARRHRFVVLFRFSAAYFADDVNVLTQCHTQDDECLLQQLLRIADCSLADDARATNTTTTRGK